MSQEQIIIGISGGSGSGKTSILNSLRETFSEDELCIVSQDNYYLPIEEQKKDYRGITNFDLPSGIDGVLLLEHIITLKSGRTVNHFEYTFNNDEKLSTEIILRPARIIVIEGLFIFHIKSISDELDLSVFVHADDTTRLNRRINRDANERGYPKDDVMYQWDNHVEPAYTQFLEPYINQCDLIIDNNSDYKMGLGKMLDMIDEKLLLKR